MTPAGYRGWRHEPKTAAPVSVSKKQIRRYGISLEFLEAEMVAGWAPTASRIPEEPRGFLPTRFNEVCCRGEMFREAGR